MAAQVAAGLSEARALVHLMLACGLFFVASLPNAVRERRGAGGRRAGRAPAVAAHLFAWGALAPLLGYGAGGGGASGRARLRRARRLSRARGRRCSGRRCRGAGGAGDRRRRAVGGGRDRAAAAVARLARLSPRSALWVWMFAASLAEAEGFAATAPGGGGGGGGLRRRSRRWSSSPPAAAVTDGDAGACGGSWSSTACCRPRAAARRILGCRRAGDGASLEAAVLVTCAGMRARLPRAAR